MRLRDKTLAAATALLVTFAALTLALVSPSSGLTAASVASMEGGNNMYNFERFASDRHSAQEEHDGWKNLGGWHCNGLLHETLEDGHVPNGEHECDTGPD